MTVLNNVSKTTLRKTADVKKNWILIDAAGVVLGRLASEVAKILRGKHKADYTPNTDGGDYVIIINAEKVRLTGNKLQDKIFYYHTGYVGGIKEHTAGRTLSGRYPERLVERAVKRMIRHGKLQRNLMTSLKVYKGDTHPHTAQNPVVYDFAAKNAKNKRSSAL